MNIQRVYLAGGINGLNDADATDWREEAKLLIRRDIAVIDPMSRDYRGKEDDNVAVIVEGDKADIESCQAIIANCVRPSWGTAMEIGWAWDNRKILTYTAATPHANASWSIVGKRRCIAVVPLGQPISPWLRYHTDEIARTVEDAVCQLGILDPHWSAYARGKMPRAAYAAKPTDDTKGLGRIGEWMRSGM